MKTIKSQNCPPPSQLFRVLFLGLIFSLFLFQCKDKTLTDESMIVPPKSKFDVPLEKAKAVGTIFPLFLNDEKLSTKNAKLSGDNPNENKEIDAIESKKDEKGNTLMYVIKYKKNAKTNKTGGYLVLSADSRAEPILAYSEEDEYDATNPGLASVLEDFAKQIISVRKTNKAPSDKVKNSWARYESNQKSRIGATYECQPWYPNYPNCCPTDYYSETIFITTNWRQEAPYNSEFPIRPICSTVDRPPAGCGSIAVSQVLNYYTIPSVRTHFNITGVNKPNIGIAYPFDNSNAVVTDRSRLIFHTAFLLESFPIDCNTATWRNNIVNGFDGSGYSNKGNRVSYNNNLTNVQMELKQRRPVIMDGTTAFMGFNDWHIWVLDGYREYQWSTVDNGQCYTWMNIFFHHNWGWGGTGTWCRYSGNIIDEGGDNYDSSLNVTIGIRP